MSYILLGVSSLGAFIAGMALVYKVMRWRERSAELKLVETHLNAIKTWAKERDEIKKRYEKVIRAVHKGGLGDDDISRLLSTYAPLDGPET